jgi:hypothetical protein
MNHEDSKIRKAMANAKATISLEGFQISKETGELVYERLTGAISEEEFLKRALKMATGDKN